jgi:hypothetical protein
MTNPFTAIPARYRQALYFVYGLAGLALAILPAWGVDVTKPAATLVIIGTAFGFTAGANVDTSDE